MVRWRRAAGLRGRQPAATGSSSRAGRSTGCASRATSGSNASRRRGAIPRSSGRVTAALAQLAAIYARLKGDVSVLFAARENLLLPVDLVHGPTGTVIAVDELPHFSSFRLTSLELYAARRSAGVRARGVRGPLPGLVLGHRRPRARPTREGLRVRRRAAGAGVPRCAPRPRRARRWAIRPSSGSQRSTATARPPTGGTRSALVALLVRLTSSRLPARRSPRR